jgi:hypothetical protein
MSVPNDGNKDGGQYGGVEALTEFVVHVVVGTLMAITLIAMAMLLGLVAQFAHQILHDEFILTVFLWMERGVVLLDAILFGISVVHSTLRSISYPRGEQP